jgi:L-amino acid N-acyltransferase YncA
VTLTIREMLPTDWLAVRSVYEEGIATGNATFETAAPDWDRWDRGHLATCRLVACDGDDVIGFAALSPVSARAVYAGVAEVSVYVASRARGVGAGRTLLSSLVSASESSGVWTLQAGIFPENQASLRLHERAGFRVVGTRERIGHRDNGWRDVILMERRSATVGR